MNRPRPGEGNNLFGGRQKIYRIAVGARTSSGDANGNEDGNWTGGKGMGGRALYGDDVASSAFARPAQSENPDSPVLSSEPHSVRSSQAPQRSDDLVHDIGSGGVTSIDGSNFGSFPTISEWGFRKSHRIAATVASLGLRDG